MSMNNSSNSPTLEFIHLVKCIVEYYATTKDIHTENPSKESSQEEEVDEMKELLAMYKNMDSNNGVSINVPEGIDSAIEKAFLAHLRFYENKVNDDIKQMVS